MVFEGKVIGIENVLSEDSQSIVGRRITFKVENTVTGVVPTEITLNTGVFGDSPGYPFLCESRYVVYAVHTEDGMATSLCFPNKALENAPTPEQLELMLSQRNMSVGNFDFYLQKMSSCGESANSP